MNRYLTRSVTLLAAMLLFVFAACGGDDPEAASAVTATPAAGSTADAGTPTGANDTDGGAADEPDNEDAAETADETQEPGQASGGAGTATVTLENGETYTFSILCSLEPQEAAGSEILFTVVSYDDPVNLDVTQFGADSFGGAANISLYDSSDYETLWEAATMNGSEVELKLDGKTVTGSGMFVPESDPLGPGVPGELVANC